VSAPRGATRSARAAAAAIARASHAVSGEAISPTTPSPVTSGEPNERRWTGVRNVSSEPAAATVSVQTSPPETSPENAAAAAGLLAIGRAGPASSPTRRQSSPDGAVRSASRMRRGSPVASE
jgi:hypothetical protein